MRAVDVVVRGERGKCGEHSDGDGERRGESGHGVRLLE
jgi:hypothetical protein